MRQEIVNVYKFNELTLEAQQVAIEKYRESIDWSFESENVSEYFMSRLGEVGLPTEDVEWSLSYCQGDGVAFYGGVDMDKLANKVIGSDNLELYKLIRAEDLTIEANLYRNYYGRMYSHWNTMSVEICGDDIETIIAYLYDDKTENGLTTEQYDEVYAKLEAFLEELETGVTNYIQGFSRELEREGYKQLEYVQTDEYIREGLEDSINEYTEDGKLYY